MGDELPKRTQMTDEFEYLKHARELFIYHADQRLRSIRYATATLAVFFVAYATVFTRSNDIIEVEKHALLFVICATGLIVTCIFKRLDRRNAYLVNVDEDAAKIIERHLQSKFRKISKKTTGTSVIEEHVVKNPLLIHDRWENEVYRENGDTRGPRSPWDSYARLVGVLFNLFSVVFAVGALYSILTVVSCQC